MTKSPGSRTRTANTGQIGCNTPGTGYAKPTPMAGLECPEAGPQYRQIHGGILRTIPVQRFQPDWAMKRRYALFGQRTPRNWLEKNQPEIKGAHFLYLSVEAR